MQRTHHKWTALLLMLFSIALAETAPNRPSISQVLPSPETWIHDVMSIINSFNLRYILDTFSATLIAGLTIFTAVKEYAKFAFTKMIYALLHGAVAMVILVAFTGVNTNIPYERTVRSYLEESWTKVYVSSVATIKKVGIAGRPETRGIDQRVADAASELVTTMYYSLSPVIYGSKVYPTQWAAFNDIVDKNNGTIDPTKVGEVLGSIDSQIETDSKNLSDKLDFQWAYMFILPLVSVFVGAIALTGVGLAMMLTVMGIPIAMIAFGNMKGFINLLMALFAAMVVTAAVPPITSVALDLALVKPQQYLTKQLQDTAIKQKDFANKVKAMLVETQKLQEQNISTLVPGSETLENISDAINKMRIDGGLILDDLVRGVKNFLNNSLFAIAQIIIGTTLAAGMVATATGVIRSFIGDSAGGGGGVSAASIGAGMARAMSRGASNAGKSLEKGTRGMRSEASGQMKAAAGRAMTFMGGAGTAAVGMAVQNHQNTQKEYREHIGRQIESMKQEAGVINTNQGSVNKNTPNGKMTGTPVYQTPNSSPSGTQSSGGYTPKSEANASYSPNTSATSVNNPQGSPATGTEITASAATRQENTPEQNPEVAGPSATSTNSATTNSATTNSATTQQNQAENAPSAPTQTQASTQTDSTVTPSAPSTSGSVETGASSPTTGETSVTQEITINQDQHQENGTTQNHMVVANTPNLNNENGETVGENTAGNTPDSSQTVRQPVTGESQQETGSATPTPVTGETQQETGSATPTPVTGESQQETGSTTPTPVTGETQQETGSATPTPATGETQQRQVGTDTAPNSSSQTAEPVVTQSQDAQSLQASRQQNTQLPEGSKLEQSETANAEIQAAPQPAPQPTGWQSFAAGMKTITDAGNEAVKQNYKPSKARKMLTQFQAAYVAGKKSISQDVVDDAEKEMLTNRNPLMRNPINQKNGRKRQ